MSSGKRSTSSGFSTSADWSFVGSSTTGFRSFSCSSGSASKVFDDDPASPSLPGDPMGGRDGDAAPASPAAPGLPSPLSITSRKRFRRGKYLPLAANHAAEARRPVARARPEPGQPPHPPRNASRRF